MTATGFGRGMLQRVWGCMIIGKSSLGMLFWFLFLTGSPYAGFCTGSDTAGIGVLRNFLQTPQARSYAVEYRFFASQNSKNPLQTMTGSYLQHKDGFEQRIGPVMSCSDGKLLLTVLEEEKTLILDSVRTSTGSGTLSYLAQYLDSFVKYELITVQRVSRDTATYRFLTLSRDWESMTVSFHPQSGSIYQLDIQGTDFYSFDDVAKGSRTRLEMTFREMTNLPSPSGSCVGEYLTRQNGLFQLRPRYQHYTLFNTLSKTQKPQ